MIAFALLTILYTISYGNVSVWLHGVLFSADNVRDCFVLALSSETLFVKTDYPNPVPDFYTITGRQIIQATLWKIIQQYNPP